MPSASTQPASTTSWWRDAVIYQVYPRSFADSNGTGLGDLPGIIDHLPDLADLGVDAVWLSPFYPSPQHDAGYDVANYTDVDAQFGTLADAERLIDTAHNLGLRVIVDIVPNHSSSEHPWFRDALAAGPGSPERSRYLFRDGLGPDGDLPPNNWESVFGGPAWTRVTEPDGTPGQWYLHLFDSSQPDFDWTNQDVWDHFDQVLRFWLDRGVDGFRVDVAHAMMKAPGLPDLTDSQVGDRSPDAAKPFWDQEPVHDVYRHWSQILLEYGEDRILCAEAWVWPLERMARYVRPGEMHQAFNFAYLSAPWSASALRSVIDESLEAFGNAGAPSTWVLSNHDVVRHPSRLALHEDGSMHLDGLGPRSPHKPDPELAHRRGRAATALMLALPGCAYLYQGEELGLPEVIDIPDERREDPTFRRTAGQRYGRDGCRVPIPWVKDEPAFGFSPQDNSWLPQPEIFGDLARDQQRGQPGSSLEFYRQALALRRELALGSGEVTWLDSPAPDVLMFENAGVIVACNFGKTPVAIPAGEVLLTSDPDSTDQLAADQAVWVRALTT